MEILKKSHKINNPFIGKLVIWMNENLHNLNE